jgi:magnesium transporter
MSEKIQIFEGKQFLKVKTFSDILIKILYGTISHFLEHLKVINMISEEIEQKINTSMSNKYLINMFTLEKSLVYYLDGIHSNTKVIDKLKINANKIGFNAENIEMLEDIIIESQQCQKQAEIYLNILTGLMDARGSIVNNNLSVLIKRLTIINIIFMPLNLLASIGGMSEYSMMTHGINWKISYSLFPVGLVMIGIMTYSIMSFIIRRLGTE